MLGKQSSLVDSAEKLKALANLAETLNLVTDLDSVMDTILTEARHFVGAEAGSIYIKQGDWLIFSYSQNEYLSRSATPNVALAYKNSQIPLDGPSLASYVARRNELLNIDDAYGIPPKAPYTHNQEFDQKTGYRCRSLLTLPLNNVRGEVIGVLQIINALDRKGKVIAFDKDDEKMMRLFSSTAAMALERAQMMRSMILRTIKMAELRDPQETGPHIQRVAALAVVLYEHWAKAKNIDGNTIRQHKDTLHMAAMLHDVGKVGIPDHILNKPSRLTNEERSIMQQHVLIGARIFDSPNSMLDITAREVILNHHEWWNGHGYPGRVDLDTGRPLETDGLRPLTAVGKKGEEIPIFGRVTAVADVFDALASERVYKRALEESLVKQIIMEKRGSHLDPEVVDILISKMDLIRSIYERFPDD